MKQKEREREREIEQLSNTGREQVRSCVESIVSGSLPRTQTVSEISGDRMH